MRIEHVAWIVADPAAVAAWYVRHLGFTVKRRGAPPANAHFLADETGTVMVEIYAKTVCALPDYASQHPLILHLALVSSDVEADVRRLTAAGAVVVDPPGGAPGGDRLCMLRDPWGFALQLAQRAEPMV